MKNAKRQVIGYLIGGVLVLGVFPFAIYSVSRLADSAFQHKLFQAAGFNIAIALTLFALGAVFGIWSVVIQNTIGEGGPVQIGNIDISPRTKNLVVTGPYKYTRNPMLFGAVMMYLALAVFLNSIASVCAVALFAVVMLIFVKISEEKRLERDFGTAYTSYRRRVSMFFPWFPKKER